MPGAPLSITSTSASDPYAQTGGASFSFAASPVYNKPFFDLANPLHLGALLALVAAGLWVWKRKK